MEECVVVGDTVSDVRAGKAAGAETIAVLAGAGKYDALLREGPDVVINSVAELVTILEI